jgi:hypothetical protein
MRCHGRSKRNLSSMSQWHGRASDQRWLQVLMPGRILDGRGPSQAFQPGEPVGAGIRTWLARRSVPSDRARLVMLRFTLAFWWPCPA